MSSAIGNQPVRVFLVDDHGILRQGLRTWLEADAEFIVVGEAPDGRTALERCGEEAVDVVVMDVQLPELNGVDATRLLVQSRRGVKVIALSASVDKSTIQAMLDAGAMGFVAKKSAMTELMQAIRNVMSGTVFVSPALDYRVAEGGHKKFAGASGALTLREREVLRLIAEGKSMKEAALL